MAAYRKESVSVVYPHDPVAAGAWHCPASGEGILAQEKLRIQDTASPKSISTILHHRLEPL